MKLTKFIYNTTNHEEWECPWLKNREDYPFEISDEAWKEYENSKGWDKPLLDELFIKYCKEHQFNLEDYKVVDYDLEKAYETIEIVFSFEGKYYRYYYDHSYCRDWCRVLEKDLDLEEVVPIEKTITITEWKKKLGYIKEENI